jgi:hypothetical protein
MTYDCDEPARHGQAGLGEAGLGKGPMAEAPFQSRGLPVKTAIISAGTGLVSLLVGIVIGVAASRVSPPPHTPQQQTAAKKGPTITKKKATREEIEAAVIGRNAEQVRAAIGQPSYIATGGGAFTWQYRGLVSDGDDVLVVFNRAGMVTSVGR